MVGEARRTRGAGGGCTAIIDHHESPNAIEGSLSVIADACAEVGVRVNTCYGVTDRHGADGAVVASRRTTGSSRDGGAEWSASTPRSPAPTTRWPRRPTRRAHGVGVHIHVAEGPDDVGAAARLGGLTGDDWLLIHGVHLADDHGLRGHDHPQSALEPEQRRRQRPALAGSPTRSDSAPTASGPTCWRSSNSRSSVARSDDVTVGPDVAWAWLEHNWSLFPEALDDTVTWSYEPMEPWSLAVHADGAGDRRRHRGEPALRDGRATRIDADEVRAKAAEQAARLHARL